MWDQSTPTLNLSNARWDHLVGHRKLYLTHDGRLDGHFQSLRQSGTSLIHLRMALGEGEATYFSVLTSVSPAMLSIGHELAKDCQFNHE